MESLVKQEGLEKTIVVSSAGVSGWHVGEPPDERMQETAQKHGMTLNSLARHFQANDFNQIDLVLAMDHSNHETLRAMWPLEEPRSKLFLFRKFDPHNKGDLEVPDPYYGEGRGFELVFEMVERTCPKILDHLKTMLQT